MRGLKKYRADFLMYGKAADGRIVALPAQIINDRGAIYDAIDIAEPAYVAIRGIERIEILVVAAKIDAAIVNKGRRPYGSSSREGPFTAAIVDTHSIQAIVITAKIDNLRIGIRR